MVDNKLKVQLKDLNQHVGQEVQVSGWLENKRGSGKVRFLMLRDGSGLVQAVMSKADLSDEAFLLFSSLTHESALTVKGNVIEDARAPGGYELSLTDLSIIHQAAEYPITPKEHGPDFLLKNRHLWLRSKKQQAIMRIRAEMTKAISNFFDDKGFIRLDAPILTPASCEGTTNLFSVEYFDQKEAYLTQSGQLYAEAGASAFGKVYTFGPTFRAEKSKTRRHLTEFWMIEPEVAFAVLDDIMDLAEDLITFFVQKVLLNRLPDLEVLGRDIEALKKIKKPFVRMTYDEALKEIESLGKKVAWGDDLGAAEETLLASQYDRPILVNRYPLSAKPFYMKPDPANPDLALCMDVLAPEGYGEIIGGSQREDDLEALKNRMIKDSIPLEPMEWYLDLRRYGSVPHSGFGLGLERSIAWVCGLKHVREAIPFPRLMDRIYP